MRRLTDPFIALTLFAGSLAAPLAGQQPQAPTRPAAARATPATPAAAPRITEDKPGLFAKAKVTPVAAMTTALASVPGGRVAKGELEEEGGKLIYSFDIKVAGRRGIEEVHVDALTGAVIKTEHEAEDEATPAKAPTKTPTKAPANAPTKAPAPTATKRP